MSKATKDTSKKPIMPFWEYIVEVVTEPIILAFASFILFTHFKSIWDTSPNFATFWARVNETTRGNVLVASIFL